MVCGTYVSTFAAASHALAGGMNCNADYPFMIARVAWVRGDRVRVDGTGGETRTCRIKRKPDGREYVTVVQASSFETLFNRRPSKWNLYPFRDEKTAAAGDGIQGKETNTTAF